MRSVRGANVLAQLIVAFVATANCISCYSEDLDEFVKISKVGATERPSGQKDAWEVLLSWRLERQGQFEMLYDTSPMEVSERICAEFESCDEREALNLAIASSPDFLPSFKSLDNLDATNEKRYSKLEVLRGSSARTLRR